MKKTSISDPEDKYKNLFGKIGVDLKQKNMVKRLLLNALCPDMNIPTVGWNNLLAVGLMGTGKTQFLNFLIDLVKFTYKDVDYAIQFTNSMQYNIDHFADVFYNLAITDDAVELQDSYRGISKESMSLSHDFFNVRHIIQQRFYRKHGYVLTVWGTQMYKGLQKRLRQAPISIFTSIFNDKDENQFLIDTLGMPYFNFLVKKCRYIYLLNKYEYNRYFVIKALEEVYYGEFDLPTSQLEKTIISKQKQEEKDIDLIIIPLLKDKVTKKELYTILDFAYSREPGELKHISKKEASYIRQLYKNGLNQLQLAQLFRRSTETIYHYINIDPQLTKNQETDEL